jgi:hypothetical protein
LLPLTGANLFIELATEYAGHLTPLMQAGPSSPILMESTMSNSKDISHDAVSEHLSQEILSTISAGANRGEPTDFYTPEEALYIATKRIERLSQTGVLIADGTFEKMYENLLKTAMYRTDFVKNGGLDQDW